MKNNNRPFFRMKVFCVLILSTLMIAPMYGNIVKLSLQTVSDCNGQLHVDLFIKASDLNTTNSTFKLGNSSIFLNYNHEVVTLASYTSVEFSANTSTQAAQANWINQSWDANNEFGKLTILLRKEPGGTNDYQLDKATWIHIGSATFDWVGPQIDPEIKVHDKFTSFNQEANDGTSFHLIEDYPTTDINELVGTATTAPTCFNDGTVTVSFPDLTSRTTLEISVDGGVTFPYSTPDNVGSYTINNLVPGAYDVWFRWTNCQINLGSYTVDQMDLPTGMATVIGSCSANQTVATIRITFDNSPERGAIEFSTDGGQTYPHYVADYLGFVLVDSLPAGITYDLWARWGNDECPVDLPDFTIPISDRPTATSLTTGTCSNDGSIAFSFPDNPARSDLKISIDGGISYPYITPDDAGSFVINNLAFGSYDIWLRWGTDECSVFLQTDSIQEISSPDVTTEVDHICSGDPTLTGGFTFTFTDSPGHSSIEFSVDGGQTYPYNVPDNSGTFSANLPTGSYNIWARWGNGECEEFLGTESIQLFNIPTVTTVVSDDLCANSPVSNGSITFTFKDDQVQTNIEFSIDGGITYPYNVADNAGTYIVNIVPGTYDLWARWGDENCPIDLPDATLGLLEIPVVTNVTAIGACNNGGALKVSFPDNPNRTHLRFSTDGGSTFPYLTPDDVGTYLITNLPAGTPDLWVQWGDNACPVDLPDVTIGAGGLVSNIVMRLFLEGALDPSSKLMRDDLRAQNLVPLIEPFSALGYTHVYLPPGMQISDPTILNVSGNDAIVDWVFYKVYHSNDPTNVLVARSALLQRDGDIVELDGVTPLQVDFFQLCNTVIAVYHRNHLAIRTAPGGVQFASYQNNLLLLDLTDNATLLDGFDPVKIVNGVQAIWAGDASNDAIISATDRSLVWNDRNITGYHLTDANLDGVVNAADRSMIWNNRNKFGIPK